MKKNWSIILAGALIASVIMAAPAKADPPTLPAEPNIVDAQGDAETNSSQGDLWHAWFTEEEDTISVHWNSAAAPPPAAYGTEWRIMASPDADGNECLLIRAQVPAGAYVGAPLARIFDACGAGINWFNHSLGDGEVEYGAMSEGGYITATFEKSLTPLIDNGATISAPRANAYFIVGAQEAAIQPVLVDESDPGTDYEVGGGSGGEPPAAEPPGKNDPPGQGNQKCSKIKDKKEKKKCKKNSGKAKGKGKGKGPKTPPPAVCEAYEPGEAGAEAETLVVTHEQTEEAPAELTVSTDPGVGAGRDPGGFGALVSHAFVNLQVDIEDASGGLWVKLSSAEFQDYDLYLDLADGTQVATAGGFGPEQDGEEGDSHTDFGSETLTGIKTNDCGGYTLDIVGAATQGGDTTLTAWIGEELWDPAAGAPVGKRMVD